MKKQFIIFAVAGMVGFCPAVWGQDPDVESPLLKYMSQDRELTLTAGARLLADAAWYNSEFTPMNSGFAITDARLRASLTYKNLYLYADFDFSGGTVTQKDIYLKYNLCESLGGIHSLKAGYFAEPSSMSAMTSIWSYRFMTRPAAVMALAPGRALGISYNFFNTAVTLTQGVFAENSNNHQVAGSQGFSIGGRWVYKPVNDALTTFHLGVSARFARMNTGFVQNEIFTTEQTLSSSIQSYVDPTHQFLNAELPWARENLNLSGELLFRTDRFFARGEYILKRVYKERPDQQIFVNQLGGLWSWTTLESWQSGNPLRTSQFDGGYLELGYLLSCGHRYGYNDEMAQLSGSAGKNSWEMVARYSYTNLNDINEGDIFLIGRKQFYPNGVVSDYPPASTSVGGGKYHSFSLGLNYAFNAYLKFMAEYQFGILDNVYYPMDKNFHMLQLRAMFAF